MNNKSMTTDFEAGLMACEVDNDADYLQNQAYGWNLRIAHPPNWVVIQSWTTCICSLYCWNPMFDENGKFYYCFIVSMSGVESKTYDVSISQTLSGSPHPSPWMNINSFTSLAKTMGITSSCYLTRKLVSPPSHVSIGYIWVCCL